MRAPRRFRREGMGVAVNQDPIQRRPARSALHPVFATCLSANAPGLGGYPYSYAWNRLQTKMRQPDWRATGRPPCFCPL